MIGYCRYTADILLGVTLRWTSFPFPQGSSNTLICFLPQKPRYARVVAVHGTLLNPEGAGSGRLFNEWYCVCGSSRVAQAYRFRANSDSTVAWPHLPFLLFSTSERVWFETRLYPTRLANVITEATLSPQWFSCWSEHYPISLKLGLNDVTVFFFCLGSLCQCPQSQWISQQASFRRRDR